ncbi:MAG: FHA domain-containing protein [Kiritimatiellia bacterium]
MPLRIRLKKADGTSTVYELADKPLTIGRSPDADITVLDERSSRMHCGIRLWDGEYFAKDLQSKNGTYLNGEKIEMARIKAGDRIRVGATVLAVEDENSGADVPGTETSLNTLQQEMDDGKGYNTILREIVSEVQQPGVGGGGKIELDDSSETQSPSAPTTKKKAFIIRRPPK